jgi:hypothetical protein
MLEVNEPVPVASVVLGSAVVGLELVLLQQTPLAVTEAPPSLDTLPPPVVEVLVMVVEIVDVLTVGTAAIVEKEI